MACTYLLAKLSFILLLSNLLVSNTYCFTIQQYKSKRIQSVSKQIQATPIKQQEAETEAEIDYRIRYDISDNFSSMEKLSNRLHSCGVQKYYFVNDNDATDQLAPVVVPVASTGDDQTVSVLQRLDPGEIYSDETIIHVKTLVWRGIYLRNSTSVEQDEEKSELADQNGDGDGDGDDSFYFVTALRAEDKVDLKRLRKIIRDQWPRKDGGTLILQMANREHAEQITGFTSGSMPPGWHSVPLKLFIDEYILDSYQKTENGTVGGGGGGADGEDQLLNGHGIGIGYDVSRYSKVMMSVGSGSSDYSLHVSLLDTIMSSVYLEDRIPICNELEMDVESNAHSHQRYVISFTRTRVEEAHKQKQKRINAIQSPRVFAIDVKKEDANSNTWNKPIKVTRRLFHVTARKKGKASEVKQMIEVLGDDFPSYMRVDTGIDDRFAAEFNKNALHFAAWKGDIETMTLLINESKRFEKEIGDVVNLVSTGEGCYGKTPIFYAITQCRDDVVLQLIALGASMLVVNNKGQSVCSLVVNKLKPETCKLMFQTEEAQLKAGGKFADYRQSHSDGKRYGDLDPRFLEVGDINMDEDIQSELNQFQEFVALDSEDDKKAMLEGKPFLLYSIPDHCLPRSVRVTNLEMRQTIWSEERKNHQGEHGEDSISPSLPSRVRVPSPIWRQETLMKKQEVVKKHSKNNSQVGGDTTNSRVKLQDGTEIDMTLLETLILQNVIASTTEGKQATYELVDDDAGIMVLDFAVDETLAQTEGVDAQSENDNHIISSSWGLDCEWRPARLSGDESPVATLQLSSASRSFVVDLQTLCQSGVKDTSTELSVTEMALCETLKKLLSSNAIRIIGFGISQDLSKLAASFPHLPCFNKFHSVIDLASFSRLVYPQTPKHFMSSLQKTVAVLLRKRMDKREQCSEWNVRPLRSPQLEYASLDATILPVLLSKMLLDNPTVEKEKGFFLRKNAGCQSSYRFTFLEDDGDCAYRISMGSVKTSYMNLKLARQMWPTFNKSSPPLPERIPLHEREKIAPASPREPRPEKKRTPREKHNAIELTLLSVDLQGLPPAGLELGYTKESCIERVVRKEVIESLPENSYLQYNRRGGVIEIGNAWMLFVNFGVGKVYSKYRNDFLSDGKMLTFAINPSRYEDGELLQNLLIPEDSLMYRKSVLMFIRGSTSDKFIFCGECKCQSHSENEDNDMVNLVLELAQFEELKTDVDGEASLYMHIVSDQTQCNDY